MAFLQVLEEIRLAASEVISLPMCPMMGLGDAVQIAGVVLEEVATAGRAGA